jgi:hypothetical protein
MKIYQSEDHAFAADVASFAANRDLPRHRWYEFKEGFSEALVTSAIETLPLHRRAPRLLDPFVGSGTTLVTAGKLIRRQWDHPRDGWETGVGGCRSRGEPVP